LTRYQPWWLVSGLLLCYTRWMHFYYGVAADLQNVLASELANMSPSERLQAFQFKGKVGKRLEAMQMSDSDMKVRAYEELLELFCPCGRVRFKGGCPRTCPEFSDG